VIGAMFSFPHALSSRVLTVVGISLGIIFAPHCNPLQQAAQGIALGSVVQQSAAVHDRQCRADIEVFVEEMYRYGDHPDSACADRMLRRTKDTRLPFVHWELLSASALRALLEIRSMVRSACGKLQILEMLGRYIVSVQFTPMAWWDSQPI
jgi:hypothetical protein